MELDKQMLTRKRRSGAAKPHGDSADCDERMIVDALVDCSGLQKLSATLKNLREFARADVSEGQSVGKVAELMKRLDDEAAKEDA